MRLPEAEPENDGPNLTPVIDMVFLLLIFFLVATRFDEQEREQDLRLASVAARADFLSASQDLVVNILADGTYKVVQAAYNEDELSALFHKTQELNPHKRVLIRSDGRAPWKSVARAVNRCKDAGLTYTTTVLPEE